MAILFKEQSLPDIEERAEVADRAFRLFQEMQTEREMDASAFAQAKVNLRGRLDDLRDQLDRYLAGEYGIIESDTASFEKWRASHQPFHWFVEFFSMMDRGGFDVIVGNPPYLETREVPYSTRNFAAEDSGAIHAICIERSIALCKKDGCSSMIVPLALVSTQRMTVIQGMLENERDCWYSNFAWRPGKLFDTVNRALTVFVVAKPGRNGETFSTAYLKWNSNIREYLIPSLRFVQCPRKTICILGAENRASPRILYSRKIQFHSNTDGGIHRTRWQSSLLPNDRRPLLEDFHRFCPGILCQWRCGKLFERNASFFARKGTRHCWGRVVE